jgi:anaerobic ribonucleoside-triphosphate reductase activating protein
VVLGRYVASLRDTSLRWRGSSNQVIRMVSDAYRGIEVEERNEVEVIVGEDGSLTVLGYPCPEVRSWVRGI